MLDFSNYYTPPNAKKEERSHYLSSHGAMGIGSIVVLVILVIFILGAWWFISQPPSCNPENQIQLSGTLLGFEKNQSFSQYWDVKINSEYFAFDYFDKDYMTKMLGENITITCCLRTRDYEPFYLYSMLNCYICEECDI